MSAIETLVAQERAVALSYRAALDRALAIAIGGRRVPDDVLDELATLEGRISALVQLQLEIESRSDAAEAREVAA